MEFKVLTEDHLNIKYKQKYGNFWNHNRINDQFRQENKMILSYDKKDGGYALEVYEITQ